jgi:hypothetical protein
MLMYQQRGAPQPPARAAPHDVGDAGQGGVERSLSQVGLPISLSRHTTIYYCKVEFHDAAIAEDKRETPPCSNKDREVMLAPGSRVANWTGFT